MENVFVSKRMRNNYKQNSELRNKKKETANKHTKQINNKKKRKEDELQLDFTLKN